MALVRPILEYANTVWDPYQHNHIEQVEKIQNKAVRFVKGNYSRTASVTTMRESLKWPTLQQRRCVARLTMFHKATNNMSAVNIPEHFERSSKPTPRGQHQVFANIHSNLELYRLSYFPRTIRCWNLLPISLTQLPTHTAFQSSLWTLINTGQIIICRPNEYNFESRSG